MNPGALESLQELLKYPSENEEQQQQQSQQGHHPGQLGDGQPVKAKKWRDPHEIWDLDEVPEAHEVELIEEEEDNEPSDGRVRPEYEFIYKQAVGTEDSYMGMDPLGKDPSSMSCEEIIVQIELPGTKSLGELDLDVKETRLVLRSPMYKIGLPLPHKVNPNKGNAKWDGGKENLRITLPVIRDGEVVIM